MTLVDFQSSLNAMRDGIGQGYSSIPLLVVLAVFAAEREGRPLSMKQLGLEVGCSLPILTKHVSQLIDAEYITSAAVTQDKRQRIILPSAKLKVLVKACGLEC